MRRLTFVLALAALPAALRAQQFEVAGRVMDAVAGTPLAHAAVDIEPLEDSPGAAGGDSGAPRFGRQRGAPPTALAAATTAADGSFRFSGVAAGRYALRASRRGYLPASLDQHGQFFAALVVGRDEPSATRIRFALQPLATIEGSVLDSSGDPVQTATISLFMQSADGTGKVQNRESTSLRPGSSTFQFDALAPGTYFLAVAGRPWFAQTGAPDSDMPNPLDVAYSATFFDGASSAAGAQPILLKAGETARANVSLHAVPAVHIRVSVQQQGNSGFSMPQLNVPAFGSSLPLGAGITTDRVARQNGTTTLSLTMSVPPGTYSIEQGAETKTLNATADTTFSADAAASAPVRLTGKLAMADGTALPAGMALRLVPEARGGGAMYTVFRASDAGDAAEGRFMGGFSGFSRRSIETAVAADGSFAADAVPPGDYRLNVSNAGSGAVVVTDAAATGGQLSGEQVLHVGADPVMLAATVALASGSVAGRVLGAGGATESGAMVLLVPGGAASAAPAASTMLYRQNESDSDGTWTIGDVVPGVYRAVAIRDGWDLAWRRPEVLAPYLAAGSEAVTVAAGGAVTLDKPLLELPR